MDLNNNILRQNTSENVRTLPPSFPLGRRSSSDVSLQMRMKKKANTIAPPNTANVFRSLLKLNSQLVSQSNPTLNHTEEGKFLKPPESDKLQKTLNNDDGDMSNLFTKRHLSLKSNNTSGPPTLRENSDASTLNELKRKLLSLISKKPLLNMFNLSIKNTEPEYDNFDDYNDFELDHITIKFPLGIINPYSHIKKSWDIIMVIILMYYCTILPVRLCFSRQVKAFDTNKGTDFDGDWLIFDVICDILLIFDILMNFFSAYENEAGFIVSSRWQITKRYLKGWFIVDLLSIIPINRNLFSLKGDDFEGIDLSEESIIAWRVIRLAKLVRIFKLNDTIEKLFSLINLTVDQISVIKFVSFIAVFINVTACLWNVLAESESFESWHQIEGLHDQDIMTKYVSSIYFTLTILLTIGYGNLHPNSMIERCWGVVCMLFGLIIYGYIISSLANSFSKLNQVKSKQDAKVSFFGFWAKTFKLPHDTLEIILNTIVNENKRKDGYRMDALHNVSSLLVELPTGLHLDIFKFIFKDSLSKIEFLQHKPKNFLVKLIPLLSHTNFNQKDFIYKEGDPALEIFLVVKGRVVSKCNDKKNKERTQVFVEGSMFGEVDLFLKRNRPASVRAETQCELWRIEKKPFLNLLSQFPDIYQELEELATIKEKYRMPQLSRYLHRTPTTHLKSNIYFHNINPYAPNIQSDNDLKQSPVEVHRGSRDNLYGTSEPELSSPPSEVFRAERGSILTEAGWPNLTKNLFGVKFRKKKKSQTLITHRCSQLFKLDNIAQSTVFKNSNSSGKTRTSALPIRPMTEWETGYLAKKKLLDELQSKQFSIQNTSEIDQVLYGLGTLENIKERIFEENEKIENSIDNTISFVESMLIALENFEKSLGQVPI